MTYVANPSLFFGLTAETDFFEAGAHTDEAAQKKRKDFSPTFGFCWRYSSSTRMAADRRSTTTRASMERGGIGGQRAGTGTKCPDLRCASLKFPLHVILRDLDVPQGHVGGEMAQQFHQRGQADSRAQRARRVGMA